MKMVCSDPTHQIGIALITVLILGILSCDSINEHKKNEDDNIELKVHETLRSYQDAINEHGLQAEFDYLDSSSMFFWIPPGENRMLRYSTIAEMIKSNASGIYKIHIEYSDPEVTVVNPQLTKYQTNVTSQVIMINGDTSRTSMHENGIVIRRKGGWKLLGGKTVVTSQ